MVSLIALVNGIKLSLESNETEWSVLANKKVRGVPLVGDLVGAEILDEGHWRLLSPDEATSLNEQRDTANEILRFLSLREECMKAASPLLAQKEEWKKRFRGEKEKISDQVSRISQAISDRKDEISVAVSAHNDAINAERDRLNSQRDQLRERKSVASKADRPALQQQIDALASQREVLSSRKRNVSDEKARDTRLLQLIREKERLQTQKSNFEIPDFPQNRQLADLEQRVKTLEGAIKASFRELREAYRKTVLDPEYTILIVEHMFEAEDATVNDGLVTSFCPSVVDGKSYSILVDTPISWRGGSFKTRQVSIGSISGTFTSGGSFSGTVISGSVFGGTTINFW